MTAIYTSFKFEDDDTIEDRQKKLYLGMISCGEDAYSLGAAIAECRKTIAHLESMLAKYDKKMEEIRQGFYHIKELRKKRAR